MKLNTLRILLASATFTWLPTTSCAENTVKNSRYQFGNILDIALTPDATVNGPVGCFTDAGSWMGFTIPQTDKWTNGFCGPLSIDNRYWFAQSVLQVNFGNRKETFTPDSTAYYPGEAYLKASSPTGTIEQRINFVNASTAIVQLTGSVAEGS